MQEKNRREREPKSRRAEERDAPNLANTAAMAASPFLITLAIACRLFSLLSPGYFLSSVLMQKISFSLKVKKACAVEPRSESKCNAIEMEIFHLNVKVTFSLYN